MRDVLQVMVAMACRLLPLVRSMAEMERSSKYSPLLRRRSPVGHSCPVWRAGRAEAARGPVALLRGCGTAPRAQVHNSCSDVPPSRTYSLCTVLWPCCLRCKNSMLGAFCLLRVPSGGLEPDTQMVYWPRPTYACWRLVLTAYVRLLESPYKCKSARKF